MQEDLSFTERGSVLVVIPTLNEFHTIATVIKQLLRGLPNNRLVRFVVADGESTDGTQAVVETICTAKSDIILLNNPRRLQSAAINLAVRMHGRGMEHLVRCDAHCSYPAGFVQQLIETVERIGSDSVVVAMDTVGNSGLQKAIAWISDTRLGSGGSAHRGGRRSGYVDHGHHALIRISSFERAGGYDESFSHNEDAEFDCRLRATGGSIYLDAEARVGYFPRSSFAKLGRQYFNYGKGRSRTVRRHPGSLRARQVAVPGYLGLSICGLILAPLWPALALPTLLYLAVIAGASLWFGVRTRQAAGVLTGPASMVMHFAWAAGFVTGMMTSKDSPWRYDPSLQQFSAADRV